MGLRILLVSDAWYPQVNGVVRTLSTVVEESRRAGHTVRVIEPGAFRTVACPTYPEIRLAAFPKSRLRALADEFQPDAVHIATEGPLGIAARRLCQVRGWRFTTSFHTRFPEYLQQRFHLPPRPTYRLIRWFHGPATRVMVATPTMQRELREYGFENTALWSRGVDTELFHPDQRRDLGYPGPVHLYVGRVAVEKNLGAFLSLPLEGTKLVVGDGPARAVLEKRHPDAVFLGALHGEELARVYASADVFVFPSRTDTFGLVMLEALASGLPVAAYPVPGPIDVVRDPRVGVLDNDLESAIQRARGLDPADCRTYAQEFSWSRCAALFREHLDPFHVPALSLAAG